MTNDVRAALEAVGLYIECAGVSYDVSEAGSLPRLHARSALALITERLAALEADVEIHWASLELFRRREAPWIEQWRQETGEHLSLPDYGDMLAWLAGKAAYGDAARLRIAALETMVRRLIDDLAGHLDYFNVTDSTCLREARALLSPPAQDGKEGR